MQSWASVGILQAEHNLKLHMQERHTNRERYFEEQARTTEKYYIPYLRKQMGDLPFRVLEVGCGEGGNLLPFARLNCDVVGVDLSPARIEQARSFFATRQQEGMFIVSDIFDLEEFHHQFSLIIVHDVVEHIDRKEQFLNELKKFLAPDGIIFVAFPAWQMPFGGHQQIAHSKIVAHGPFIHLLPSPVYRRLLRLLGERPKTVGELMHIKETRCTIEHFQKITCRTGYRMVDRKLYFINPHYETKFGWTPRRLNHCIAQVPYVRNFFSSSCFYLLKLSASSRR